MQMRLQRECQGLFVPHDVDPFQEARNRFFGPLTVVSPGRWSFLNIHIPMMVRRQCPRYRASCAGIQRSSFPATYPVSHMITTLISARPDGERTYTEEVRVGIGFEETGDDRNATAERTLRDRKDGEHAA